MHPALRRAYERELAAAAEGYPGQDLEQAFFHLERAHILGRAFTLPQTRAHCWMLKVGWRRRDLIEITGRMARIVGTTLFTWI